MRLLCAYLHFNLGSGPLVRKLQSIITEKNKNWTQCYRQLWGSRRAVPTIVRNRDGDRQFEQWDSYIEDVDKNHIRTSHCETSLLLAILVSTVCHQAQNSESRIRKYRAAAILRDLVNSALGSEQNSLQILPFGEAVGLPLAGCHVAQAREFMLSLDNPGLQILHWWNAVLAADIVLPADLLTNPATCFKFMFIFCGLCFRHSVVLKDYICSSVFTKKEIDYICVVKPMIGPLTSRMVTQTEKYSRANLFIIPVFCICRSEVAQQGS